MEHVIEVDRHAVTNSRISSYPHGELADGQVRFAVEQFALTSNNITYAVFGDGLRYWDFFPVPDTPDAWGRVPVWGFARAVESRHAEVPVGTRVYGYLPMSTTLVMTPGRVDETGFIDVAAHRQPMATAYNRYTNATNDSADVAALANHRMVLWPLFMTSFMIDDFVAAGSDDRPEFFGASVAVISSASSKTSIAAAHLMKRRPGIVVVGLTSASNRSFVESLGCYDTVVVYGDESSLPDGPAVYVDIAGNRAVNHAVHARYGDALTLSLVVGGTHWNTADAAASSALAGPKPEFFFAPAQIARRTKEWGKDGLEQRVDAAWRTFASWSDGWLTYDQTVGPEAVRALYDQMVTGTVDPRVGHICRVG